MFFNRQLKTVFDVIDSYKVREPKYQMEMLNCVLETQVDIRVYIMETTTMRICFMAICMYNDEN